jgi:mono/diheme cytochrome c family protein
LGRERKGRARWRGLAAAATLALASSACTPLDNMLARVPIFGFMRNSPAFDPYEAPRPAPQHSVPFLSPGGQPMPPQANTEAALIAFGAETANPVPATPQSLQRGKVMYDVYCLVCHGPAGRGDGPIIAPAKFPFASDLAADITVNRTDGYLYAITRAGRGLMPAYGDRIPHEDRWHVVNYIRYLAQQARGAPAPATAPGAEGTE